MNKKWIKLSFLALMAVFFNTAVFSADKDKVAVKNAEKNFYVALNLMFTGVIDPMKAVWSHTADVTYMGPNGNFIIGWDKVQKEWESQASMKLGGKVKPMSSHIIMGQNTSIVSCIENGQNKDGQGRVEKVSIRATNVFRKENGQWKMIVHHTDLLPFLAK